MTDPARSPASSARLRRTRLPRLILLAAAGVTAVAGSAAQTPDPGCFRTGGGHLEICRGGEAEGVFAAPRACEYAANVQLLRLPGSAGPLQAVYQGQTPEPGRRGRDSCEARRATSPLDGGALRSGRMPEQLATLMPPTQERLWEIARAVARPKPAGRGRLRDQAPVRLQPESEGLGARNPMVIGGRDWAGDDSLYVFLLATVPTASGNRHALLQARTADLVNFEIRGREDDGHALTWQPFASNPEGGRAARRRRDNPSPSAVLDETGAAVIGNCAGEGFDRNDLIGSISIVDRVYHYFYTDVLPADCGQPPAKRRMALYLRTSKDLTAERVWSAARTIAEPLPSQTLIRVAKAKGMNRWVAAYSCNRPANTMDGPVADLCVQYTADLSLGSLAGLTWYSEPIAIMRAPTYLGLRSGGDGAGRFGRSQHFWMTDRAGNLDTPASYPSKAGFLTWLDRLAPGGTGPNPSSVYGRPVYWGTWSVRPVESR